MRIFFAAIGTRGDIEPFLALAIELQERGYDVTLGCAGMYEELIRTHGVKWQKLSDMKASDLSIPLSKIPEGLPWNWQRPLVNQAYQKVLIIDRFSEWANSLLHALNYADAFVLCPSFHSVLQHLVSERRVSAENLRKPIIVAVLSPLGPKNVSKLVVGTTLRMMLMAPWFVPLESQQLEEGQWQVTNFVALNSMQTYTPPQKLTDFLQGNAPLVVFSMGSVLQLKSENFAKLFQEVGTSLGIRALIQTGWSNLSGESSEHVYFAGDIPHQFLFDYADCIVHHGGAGTTARGLHAGKPAVILPQCFDQFYWGEQLEKLGLGRSLDGGQLSFSSLRSALMDVLERPAYLAAAQDQQRQLRKLNGKALTCDAIEAHLKFTSYSSKLR